MPRHEPAGRETAGEPPNMKVKMQRDETGKLVPVFDKQETVSETRPDERPPSPGDPRPSVNPDTAGL